MCGFLVTSIRHDPVHDNRYMPVYAAIEETGLPLAFHAGPTWEDEWMKTMNRFLSMHAISFVHCNIVHMTNWLVNGLPERFPRLKVIWVESGLAWVPFLMQRLDHEYLKRTSEAPLLKRPPSEYMREMYYTSQPMEMDHLGLLESTLTAINAETQLVYASDWPHWDFDLPSVFLDLPFLSEQAKRNILGLNAARLFDLDVPALQAGADLRSRSEYLTSPPPAPALLAGVRVVDMAEEKGELCGRFLADLGADVIRVEPPAGALALACRRPRRDEPLLRRPQREQARRHGRPRGAGRPGAPAVAARLGGRVDRDDAARHARRARARPR